MKTMHVLTGGIVAILAVPGPAAAAPPTPPWAVAGQGWQEWFSVPRTLDRVTLQVKKPAGRWRTAGTFRVREGRVRVRHEFASAGRWRIRLVPGKRPVTVTVWPRAYRGSVDASGPAASGTAWAGAVAYTYVRQTKASVVYRPTSAIDWTFDASSRNDWPNAVSNCSAVPTSGRLDPQGRLTLRAVPTGQWAYTVRLTAAPPTVALTCLVAVRNPAGFTERKFVTTDFVVPLPSALIDGEARIERPRSRLDGAGWTLAPAQP